LEINPKN